MTDAPLSPRLLSRIQRWLARRDFSRHELLHRLLKFYDAATAQKALEWVEARGWLKPPEELAVRWAEQLAARHKSAVYIRQYLKKKGLPPVAESSHDEREKIRLYLAKNRAAQELHSTAARAKFFQRLKTRGFKPQHILEVFDELQRSSV